MTNKGQAGFTLLEILLVIVMIAVLSAMVAPSITSISGGSVDDEAERLQGTMRLALEEAQLSSVPLRWVAERQRWYFEVLTQGSEGPVWQPFEAPPVTAYTLPYDIVIAEVRQSGEFAFGVEVKKREDGVKEPPLGVVLLLPDGTLSPSEIVLSNRDGSITGLVQVKQGPAGIRLIKDEDSALLNK